MSLTPLYFTPIEWSCRMDMEKAVGDELRACRQKKQISQEQLGFDAGVHRTYVSLIERGAKSPTLGVLFRLCQALDVPPARFVQNIVWKER
jgi:transcriptional regulator with XRE-family HTH domain